MVSRKTQEALDHLEKSLRKGNAQVTKEAFQHVVGASDNAHSVADALAAMLLRLYKDLETTPLVAFAQWLTRHPAQEITKPAMKQVEASLQAMQQWRKTLRDMQEETLAQQIRSRVRGRDVGEAARLAAQFLRRGPTAKAKVRLCAQLGAVLGSLNADRNRAESVLARVVDHAAKLGLEDAHVQTMRDTFRQTHTNQSLSELSQQETQWNRIHVQAVVQLMRFLPGGQGGAKVTDEQVEKFYQSVHAIMAAYYCDSKLLDFLEVVRLLQEFCPREEGVAGPVAGVEDVAFMRMRPADKLTSVRALRQLGQVEKINGTVLKCAKSDSEPRDLAVLIRFMGGLSSPCFQSFLAEVLKDRKSGKLESVVVESLGRIGDPQSQRLLVERLDRLTKIRVIDPPLERRIAIVIAALGRIARHPKTSEIERNTITLHVFRRLPKNRNLGFAALQDLCSYKPGSLSPEVRKLMMQHLVANLWSQDMASKLQPGDPTQKSEMGFREGLVQILVSAGQENLPLFLEEAEKRSMQFSGAYMAVGEALAKMGDERALPLLETMMGVSLRVDPESIPGHMREVYYDAAQDKHVPLTRDKICLSLLYAIRDACGRKGMAYLRALTSRIKNKELPNPGNESMNFLAATILGKDNDEVAVAGKKDVELPALTEDDLVVEGSESLPEQAASSRPRMDDPLRKLEKDILGRGLLGVKMPKRISAIQEVAARKEVEGVQALCKALVDDEKVVHMAADTALAQFLNKDDEQTFRLSVYEVLEAMRKAPDKEIGVLQKLLVRLGVEEEPLKDILLRFIDTESDERMKMRLSATYKMAEDAFIRNGGDFSRSASGAGAAGGGQEHQKVLQLKRDYFAQRKAWIAGGKQGPPPKPPEGVEI